MKKVLTEQQVDDLLKLKWGSVVTEASGPTLTSNKALAKVFGVKESQIKEEPIKANVNGKLSVDIDPNSIARYIVYEQFQILERGF